jgi:hypothetical protein
MKKVIGGLIVIGAVVALRPVVKRKGQQMRGHCAQMAAKCKEMMAQSEAGGADARALPAGRGASGS